MLEEHLATGWEYIVDVVLEAPLDEVAARLPRTLGRLEPVDPGTTRLVASTSSPLWYAQQLAAVPVPMRVVGGPELRGAVTAVGRRPARRRHRQLGMTRGTARGRAPSGTRPLVTAVVPCCR